MTAIPPSPFVSSSDLVSHSDVSAAAAASPPAPLDVAAVINSCRKHVDVRVPHEPGPSFATGMSSDAANAGGEHEEVAPVSLAEIKKSAACESTSLVAADLNVESFSCRETKSGIGSARATSAMLHPGVVDGSTTQLAGRDSGDRAERRPPISELSLRRANASDVLSGALPVGPGRKTGSDLAHVPAVETLANLGVTAGETAPNSDPVDHPTIPPTPDTADDASASPLFSSFDPGPCGIDFEHELDMLEFELLLVGIPMNARTFFTEAVNAISPASSSSA